MEEKIYTLWLWDKWGGAGFGDWTDVYHESEEKCKEHLHRIYPSVEANGKYAISIKKPNYKLKAGDANPPYHARNWSL